MFIAEYESSNFFFEGTGNTEQQARAMLRDALRHHCKATGAILGEFFYLEDVYVRELKPGQGLIDRERVCERDKWL